MSLDGDGHLENCNISALRKEQFWKKNLAFANITVAAW